MYPSGKYIFINYYYTNITTDKGKPTFSSHINYDNDDDDDYYYQSGRSDEITYF